MKNEYTLFKHLALRGLDAALNLLEKAKTSGMEEAKILEGQLAPDMFNFTKQIQMVSDLAKNGVARYAQTEAPKYEDNETTLDQLVERIQKSKAFVESVDEEKFAGAENIKVAMPWMGEGKYYTSSDYAQNFVIPNFFFHLTTSYNILRNLGLKIGKPDYIGFVEMQSE